MKKTALILLALSTLAQADFSRSTAGVVTDSKTKLEWQDNNISARMSWSAAIAHCEDMPLDGGDWRLPNINELKSIIVDKAAPTIDDEFENTGTSPSYWSSTTYANSTNNAWCVSFSSGTTSYASKITYSNYYRFVRCVRAGQ